MDDEIIEIASFRLLHEAELAATALKQAGINCTLPDRFGHGRSPQEIFTGQGYRVLVRASDRERAAHVLRK